MIKVKVYTIGRSKEPWLLIALEEYQKRLSGSHLIEWVFAKNDAHLTELAEPGLIALDLKGDMVDSVGLISRLTGKSRLSFFIGGAEGLPKEVLAKAGWKWSLSKLTFPHQIVRLLLLEQLYRSVSIERGDPYHK